MSAQLQFRSRPQRGFDVFESPNPDVVVARRREGTWSCNVRAHRLSETYVQLHSRYQQRASTIHRDQIAPDGRHNLEV